jgi:Tol biopolymer transport system component
VALAPGARLGAYEILTLIGQGGMGEVYRATDTKLKRQVAIKVMPAAVASDPERLARFQREAEVLAALNHPNIAAIYGFEDSGATHALVMELVEGPTLSDRIANGPIPLNEALPIARQIAEALEAAHELGIIHRDLKPANIKVTPGGTVKVLDFGLAKFQPGGEPEADLTQSPTVTVAGTRAGVILGTAAYMSPEQARGRPVDKRADIWAFGCVLYETLTGRAAFARDTISETIAAILERDPAWDQLPDSVPAEVTRVLRRCLDKDQKRRLRDVADVRIELDDAVSLGAAPRLSPVPRKPRSRAAVGAVVLAGLGALVGLAGSAVWSTRGAASAPENPLARARFTRFTDFEGAEHDAAISPDGKFVSFVSDRDGQFDVWMSQVGTGRFTNLTKGKFPNATSLISIAGFSGDGTELWFHEADTKLPLMLLPLLGGPARVFLSKSPAKMPPLNAIWSPDGARLVYHTGDDGDPLFVADRAGANARQIFIDRPGVHNHFPAWSPDGRWIYYVSGSPIAADQDLWRMASDGGSPQRLTHHENFVAYPAPIDLQTVLYVARDRDGSGPWLWALDVQRTVSERVSFGLEQYISVAASADGRRLVATVANPTASLWSVPLGDRPAEERDVKNVAVPTVRALAPRFSKSALFYLSSHGTGDGLWRAQNGQAIELWRGADGPLLEPAAVSADGRRVAIVLRKNGKQHLHTLAADGGDLQSVGETLDVTGAASWSPDGKWIAIAGNDGNGRGLFKVPLDGGMPVRLTAGAAINPAWSPIGDLIAYEGPDLGAYASLVAVRPDGSPVDLPPINLRRGGARVRFLPDGSGLVYMTGLRLDQDFWLLDFSTKKTRLLTHLTNTATMQAFDITPDGKQIVFDRLRENSDIVLIDLPKSTGH